MLTLSKKTDYALISLAYLAEHPGRMASARQIAGVSNLPLALLMQILKTLHQGGILVSTRGSKGGYRLAVDLETLTLRKLIQVVHGSEAGEYNDALSPAHSPLRALRGRLVRFLEDVKISDLVRPGHRIDVPIERVRVLERVTRDFREVREDQVQPV